ncbi:CPBP family intramembrane glutamic endopeptidase [Devriesea agamarum]|uniref:CPBP family intramembrane glutamic endopeptidase n=1 Tax=Devriesea agamarum TaxID=472569 RepID=UPI00071C4D59|nr:CPBP family intramembrane glutamic endopeptidase [Devriesea agamarum]
MLLSIVSLCAILVAVVQVLLMGVIGYPLARRQPDGMEKFHRSGFVWWVIALALVTVVGLWAHPQWFTLMAPSSHSWSLLRFMVPSVIALAILVAVELISEKIIRRTATDEQLRKYEDAYEGQLPAWIATRRSRLLIVLALVALLEEIVFRAIGLGGLLGIWDLPKPLAAGICAVAFGLSHWYGGWRHVTIKIFTGAVLVWVTLSAGWVSAALVHVALNIILTLVSRNSQNSTKNALAAQ